MVGFDSPNKKLVEKGQWFWHVRDLEQVQNTLNKFFLLVGKPNKPVEKVLKKPVAKPFVDLLKQTNNSPLPVGKYTMQAQMLTKQKVHYLADFYQIRFLDKYQKAHCCLLNAYQKEGMINQLSIGHTYQLVLNNGTKHSFLNKIL